MEAFYLTLKKNYYHPLLSLRTTNVMCVYCDKPNFTEKADDHPPDPFSTLPLEVHL